MAREDPQLKLRLPQAMRDRIAVRAAKNNRSMNAEIVARLEESLEGQNAVRESLRHIEAATHDMRRTIDDLYRAMKGMRIGPPELLEKLASYGTRENDT